MVASGTIEKVEAAACIPTGHLLKDTDALGTSLRGDRTKRTIAAERTIESMKRREKAAR
ncbi:hypothetical protein [Cohnella hongkongensis]|uniref:Uncharacterized protein n=1 Tax=Cohnella hongkongensis TaxID=178337 RepID=A0ABV9FG81_9BACL